MTAMVLKHSFRFWVAPVYWGALKPQLTPVATHRVVDVNFPLLRISRKPPKGFLGGATLRKEGLLVRCLWAIDNTLPLDTALGMQQQVARF